MSLPMAPDIDLRSVPLPRSFELVNDTVIESIIERGLAKTRKEAIQMIEEAF